MKKTYKVEVDCANCAAKMEAGVKKLPGVVDAVISFMTQKLTLETEADDQTAILAEVKKTCKRVDSDFELYA